MQVMSTERSPAVKGVRSMHVRDIPLTASVTNVASVGADQTGVAPAEGNLFVCVSA